VADRPIRHRVRGLWSRAGGWLMALPEPLWARLQRRLGRHRLAWVFLTPNLLILTLFTFVPIAINLWYAVTGGVQLYPGDRPFVGLHNMAQLFSCADYSDYTTCTEDRFFRALGNSAAFAAVQVGLMVVLATVTALALHRKIRGRGFFRAVFFYPVLLSPVVV